MLPLLPALLALFSVAPPAGPYRAVVVNATTSQPLPGVSITDLQTQAGAATDAQGRFSLAGPTAHFRLHSLGFADLEATRLALPAGQVDTLRLLPDAIRLAEVSVRPTRPVVLSSVGTKPNKRKSGSLIIPGGQFGILFRPAADMLPAVVQQISVQFEPNKQARAFAGRVRVRLVALERGSSMTPSAHDLLPVAATYTAAELAALPNYRLTVDLSAYSIRLPASGFFVLVEGLATEAGETYVTDKLVMRDGEQEHVVVTATNPQDPATFRETPTRNFPAISWTSSLTEVETVTRLGYNQPWHLRHHNHDSPKAENPDISLTILAE